MSTPQAREWGLAALVLLATVAALYFVGGRREPAGESAAASSPPLQQGEADLDAPGLLSEHARREAASVPPGGDEDAAAGQGGTMLQGSFLGTVFDPDDGPIEGARVRFFPNVEPDSPAFHPIARGETDAGGAFEVPVPRGVDAELDLRIEVSAEGFATRSLSPVFANEAIPFVLPWAAEIDGVVVDAESGAPVQGVRVATWNASESTASDGTFHLDGVAVGEAVDLLVQHPDYALRSVRVVIDSRPSVACTVRLSRGVPMDLTIVDGGTGVPIAGAIVRVPGRDATLATTDATGVARLRVRPQDGIQWEVEAEGYAVFLWIFEVVDVRAVRSVRVPMVGIGWIEGALRDSHGTPLSGAWLFATTDSHESGHTLDDGERKEFGLFGYAHYDLPAEWSKATDEEGGFGIPVLPGEKPFTVRGGAKGFVGIQHGPVWVRDPGIRARVDLVQDRAGTLRGVVRRNGKPSSRGRVVLEGAGAWSTSRWVDFDGTYEIEGVPPGTMSVRLRDIGSTRVTPPEPASVTIRPGRETVHDFDWVEQTTTISGTVLGPDGAPALGVLVQASRLDGQGGDANPSSQVSEDGRFSLEVSAGFLYHVSARRGAASDEVDGVVAGTEGLELRLPDTGRLRVRFVDEETRGVITPELYDWQALAWRPAGEENFRSARALAIPQQVVELEFPVQTPGAAVDLFVTLSGDGYVPRRFDGLVLARGDDDAQVVELELERGIDCTLAVVGAESSADQLRGHVVFVLREDDVDLVRGPFPEQAGLSNQRVGGIDLWLGRPGLLRQLVGFGDLGRQLVRGLRPGRYTLRVFPPDFAFEPEMFDVRESGECVDLELHPVSGQR